MSKQNTSRSRAEKSRAVTNTVTAPVSTDIVPGKYTDADMNLSIEQEINEEFIFSLLNESIENAERQIYNNYLMSRLAPYTVGLAKQAIIKILEWEFLAHDLAEGMNEECVWEEDKEPDSCIIDSWAQGYFPKRQATMEFLVETTVTPDFPLEESSKVEESEEELEEVQKEVLDEMQTDSEIAKEMKNNEEMTQIETITNEYLGKEEEIEEEIEINNLESKPKMKKVFKPYRGKIQYEDLTLLTETLMETEERLEKEQRKMEEKLKRGYSSQSISSRQNEPIDYEGRVIQKLFSTSLKNCKAMKTGDILQHSNNQLLTVMKVPTEQLTMQRVKANHKMIDSSFTRINAANKEAGNLQNARIRSSSLQKTSDDLRTQLQMGDKTLPASMIDSIEPVLGVTVQEGDRVKKSVIKKNRSSQLEKELSYLRPIKTQSGQPSHLIEEIVNAHQIQIKPVRTPVPPINTKIEEIVES